MGRRSQRSKDASAVMAARVAAGIAPWTRTAGFIANRLKPLCVPCLCMREQQMHAQIEELQQQNARHHLTAFGAVYAAEQRAALAACTAHALTLQLGLLQHANAVMAGEAVALQQRAAEGDQAAAAAADLEARCQDLEAQCQDLVMECHEHRAECLKLSAAAPPSSPTASTPYQSSLPASQDKRIRLVQNRGPSINVLRRLIADWESKPRAGQHRHNKDELATVQLCHTQVARYSTARYCVEYSLAALRLLVDCNLSFEKVQETIVRALGLHILPGQQLEDRVPCGMTLRRAMDDICHQAHKHQSGFVHLESHDAEHQCAKLIECLKAAGYWTAHVKILFAVCDSDASNVGKHSGVVMRLAAAKIKAGHQVHNIWVVHCWEHVLHNSVRHLCQAYGCSAQMQREGHNSQLTRDTGMLTPAMEQLLSRYYRATHMTNAVPETMLKQKKKEEEEDYSGIHRRALREELPPGARPAPTNQAKRGDPPTLPPS
ncbi:hypothetical protein QJQ45_004227 [Haematococcus lacustris]|nr:hypothetical protein QJQ45_004227 [Haematococcus lacustris]